MRMSYQKALKFAKSGKVLYRINIFVNVNRFVTPEVETVVVTVYPQYFTKKHPQQILNPSAGWAYFTKLKQAECFADTIRNGERPELINQAREWHFELDQLDESFGICDRGLGGFTYNPDMDYVKDMEQEGFNAEIGEVYYASEHART